MEKHEVFIGVDVSKAKLDITVMTAERKVLYHEVCPNEKKELSKAFTRLRKATGTRPSAWLFCLEHTGVYAMPLVYALSAKEVAHIIVPAVVIQRSLGLKRGKNDKADSRDIAKYACVHGSEAKKHRLPEAKLIRLKLLLGHRDRLMNARKSFLVAQKETGKFMDAAVTRELLKESRSVTNLLEERIKRMDAIIMELVRSDQELDRTFNLATSVPGIGPQIACNLMVITRCFTTFDNARQLACYMGIAPFEYSSGSSIRGRSRVSHLANKKLKSLISMGALNAKRLDRELALFYQRKVDEGKNGMSVMNAVRNKLVARVFATVKRGTPYVPTMKYAA